jgi:hypothetical protein
VTLPASQRSNLNIQALGLLTLVLFAAIAVFVVLDHRRRAKDEF